MRENNTESPLSSGLHQVCCRIAKSRQSPCSQGLAALSGRALAFWKCDGINNPLASQEVTGKAGKKEGLGSAQPAFLRHGEPLSELLGGKGRDRDRGRDRSGEMVQIKGTGTGQGNRHRPPQREAPRDPQRESLPWALPLMGSRERSYAEVTPVPKTPPSPTQKVPHSCRTATVRVFPMVRVPLMWFPFMWFPSPSPSMLFLITGRPGPARRLTPVTSAGAWPEDPG
jgi:hypothetical protein